MVGRLKSDGGWLCTLQITEWMVSHDEYKLSSSDYAARLDLMTIVLGLMPLNSAERYIEGLPKNAKTDETYTALLHSYQLVLNLSAKLRNFLSILRIQENKDIADQIWKSLRMTKLKIIDRNYVALLSSYLMLGHFDEVEEVIDQWKNSTTSVFDNSLCNSVADAFAEAEFRERAETFCSLLNRKTDSVDDSEQA